MDRDDNLASVIVDEEFENLVKPLSDIEMHRLQFAVMTNGFAQVRVWNNIVLCDSSIYDLCIKCCVSCNIVQKEFSNRSEALVYVCTEELKREDLTYEYKKYLIGKIYNLEKRSSASTKITKTSIATTLGNNYFISYGAVQKYGQYAEAIDRIYSVASDLARFILDNKLRISHENTIDLARFPNDELITIMQITKDQHAGRMTFSDIKHEIRWKTYNPSSRSHARPRKEDENVEIKKMPAYDPDADLMGVAMTIPSWIKAITRAVEHTDLSAATPKAKSTFKNQLYALDDAVIQVIGSVEG